LISRTYHPACHFENLFLLAAHIFCAASGSIVPAGQMQESMDRAKSSFLVRSVSEASSVVGDHTRSDQDLSVWEGNHIGGSGIIEEGSMHPGDCPVTNDGRLDLLKSS
jgi:hypothetical protein